MKADITRSTFDPQKNYSGVRMQQGRIQVDADWNEQLDILLHRERTRGADVIGRAGVPRDAGQEFALDFSLTVGPSGKTLGVRPGRIYVDGVLCELRDESREFDPAAVGSGSVEAGTWAVYLDVWERDVHAVEDPSIVDPGLLVPDTAIRSKVEWTLRAVRLDDSHGTLSEACGRVLEDVRRSAEELPRLTAFVREDAASDSPCIVPSTAGYRGIENQLYRVEIHKAGSVGDVPTFKWSRENGAAVFGISALTSTSVTIESIGVEGRFDLPDDAVVELVSVDREADGQSPGPLLRIDHEMSEQPGTYAFETLGDSEVFDAIKDAFSPDGDFFLRRWDHTHVGSDDGAIPIEVTSSGALEFGIEEGISVRFQSDDTMLRSGDYWLIPARASNDRSGSGELLWPEGPAGDALSQIPDGTSHVYAALGLVEVTDDESPRYQLLDGAEADCRNVFPPLIDIRAEDVRYDPESCHRTDDARNVQDAIDNLCASIEPECDIRIGHGADWRERLDVLTDQQDTLEICVPPGRFSLEQPLEFEGLASVRITGAGAASQLDTGEGLGGLRFSDCGEVVLRDFAIDAGHDAVSAPSGTAMRAVVDCVDCADVSIRDVDMSCDGDWIERTYCIYATFSREAEPEHARLEVRDCKLLVGHRQTGILAVNAGVTLIQDNLIWVDPQDPAAEIEKLAEHKKVRRRFVAALVDHSASSSESDSSSGGFTAIPLDDTARISDGDGGGPLRLAGSSFGTNIMSLVDSTGTREFTDDRVLLDAVKKNLENILFERDTVDAEVIEEWGSWGKEISETVSKTPYGMGGIFVAGHRAERVRILGNEVLGFVRGIHVGLSDDSEHDDPTYRAEDVDIRENQVGVVIPHGYKRERHGIFVGNFDRLTIDDNRVERRYDLLDDRGNADGIRVYGEAGEQMLIRGNSSTGLNPGIRTVFIEPSAEPNDVVWAIGENLADIRTQQVPNPRTGHWSEVNYDGVETYRNR
jgi:hypothetical protein